MKLLESIQSLFNIVSERNRFGRYPGYRGEQSHDKTREQISGEVFWFHLRRQQLQRGRGARREGKLIFFAIIYA